MPAFTFANLTLLNLLVLALRAHASLYPTVPIQHSTLHGGQWNELRWKDSGDAPTLNNIGRVDIQLFADHARGVKLATLATDVDPTQRRQEVFIPSDVYENGHDFFIRFRSTDPPLSFWTADFAIDGLTGSSSSPSSTASVSSSNASSASGDRTTSPSENGSNNSNLQQGSPSQSGGDGEDKNDVVTVTMEMPSSSSTPSPSGGGGRANAVGAVSSDARRLASMTGAGGLRNVRFNLVFGLFPALLGVMMAL